MAFGTPQAPGMLPGGPLTPAARPLSATDRPGDALIERLIADTVELRFERFLAGLPDPMLGVDRQGVVRFANAHAERLFGRPRSQMTGRPAEGLLREDAGGLPRSLADPELRQMETPVEMAVVRPDGTEIPVEVTLSLVGTDDGLWVIAAIRDISDRKRVEEALRAKEEAIRAARDAALETSRLKSRFLATMSHEIRTPMNGVLGLTHLLLQTDVDALQRRYLVALRESGEGLLQLINDILDFSKVEAGRLELESVEFDLLSVVEGVVSLLGPAARDKGLTLDYDAPVTMVRTALGDPGRLRQVLTNLTGNAVKFTDSGGVLIKVRPSAPGRIRFEVVDSGIGIDPAARRYLLDPFTQADASTTRRFGGTGLGLAICRQLVELMGGTLDYRSQPGKGSAFWFDVPLAIAVPAPVRSLAAVRTAAGLDEPASSGGAVPEPSPQRDSQLAGPANSRVLVVDDSAVNQLVARAVLEARGFAVDLATGGSEAVDAVRHQDYDLILMDVLMPMVDGLEATAQIRQFEGSGHHTPIVAITASAMSGDRERCLQAGMDDYITKPIRPDALVALVNRHCAGAA
ncbi:MAG TPA: ATP-binding protein [Actinomycetota bacterium]|nr:ATP-binding protein [Actinomycetota bacterium]